MVIWRLFLFHSYNQKKKPKFFFLQNAFYYSLNIWEVDNPNLSIQTEHNFMLQFQSVLLSLHWDQSLVILLPAGVLLLNSICVYSVFLFGRLWFFCFVLICLGFLKIIFIFASFLIPFFFAIKQSHTFPSQELQYFVVLGSLTEKFLSTYGIIIRFNNF